MLGSNGSSQKADVEASDEHRQHLRASTERKESKPLVKVEIYLFRFRVGISNPPKCSTHRCYYHPFNTTCKSHELLNKLMFSDWWPRWAQPQALTDAHFPRNTFPRRQRRKVWTHNENERCAWRFLQAAGNFWVREPPIVCLPNKSSWTITSKRKERINWQLDKYFSFGFSWENLRAGAAIMINKWSEEEFGEFQFSL